MISPSHLQSHMFMIKVVSEVDHPKSPKLCDVIICIKSSHMHFVYRMAPQDLGTIIGAIGVALENFAGLYNR